MQKMKEDVQGPSLPSKTCSEGQMYAAEEVSVSTVSQVIQGVCTHIQTYHGQGGQTWTCETCSKVLNSLGAHINHQLWHRGLTAQRRACRIHERNLQCKMFRMKQKAFAKKVARQKKAAGNDPSKLAPPKLIPAHGILPG